MKNILKQIIADFHDRPIRTVKERLLKVPIHSGKIISLVGPRRAGKSYYLYGIMHQLLASGVDKTNIVYINFEDERLTITGNDLHIIIDAYLELYNEKQLQDVYFFFDEIQNVEHREKFVRRIYDEGIQNIFITGSNAKLLSKEISTSLRGRSVSYELLPLSFLEFLGFHDQKLHIYTTRDKIRILHLQKEFLKWGGFPEIISFDQELKLKTLQEYFEVMMYNDIVERYRVKDVVLLKQFIKSLLQTATKEFSVNKIANDLRSMGFTFDKNILYDFLEFLETVYFVKIVSKYDFSFKKQRLKKSYFIDSGFLTAMSFKFSDDYGKLLENMVFVELYRKYADTLFFLKNGSETDFILYSDTTKKIYQVCYELHEHNIQREIQGCENAMKKFKLPESTIITFEQEQEITTQEGKIQVIPFYKWILDKQ